MPAGRVAEGSRVMWTGECSKPGTVSGSSGPPEENIYYVLLDTGVLVSAHASRLEVLSS